MNILFLISLSSLTLPVMAGHHKNTSQSFHQKAKSDKKKQSKQAKYVAIQVKQGFEETKKFFSSLRVAPMFSYFDVSTPEGMLCGLLLATHVMPVAAQVNQTQREIFIAGSEENFSEFNLSNRTHTAAARTVNSPSSTGQLPESAPFFLLEKKQHNDQKLKCKKRNEKKLQKTTAYLKQKKVFQETASPSVLVIGHDLTQAASKARDSLIEWAVTETGREKVVCVDAPNVVVQDEFLSGLREHSKLYASYFDEPKSGQPACAMCEQLRKDWPRLDLMAQVYRAHKFNLNVYGINDYIDSKEQLYINKVFGGRDFCTKITTDPEFCKQITKDIQFCQTIANHDDGEKFCNKITAITSRPRFYEENQMDSRSCMGRHPETTTTQIYHRQALNKLFKNNTKDLIVIVYYPYMFKLNNFFKSKYNINIQFVNTAEVLNETETERGYVGLKQREKIHICPKGSAEEIRELIAFQRFSHHYHPEDCDEIQ